MSQESLHIFFSDGDETKYAVTSDSPVSNYSNNRMIFLKCQFQKYAKIYNKKWCYIFSNDLPEFLLHIPNLTDVRAYI